MRFKRFFFCLLLLVFFLPLRAEYISEDIHDGNRSKSWIILPYLFSSDTMGFTVGAVGIWNGYYQKQMTIVASGFLGARRQVQKYTETQETKKEYARSSGVVFGLNNYRPFFVKRLFISVLGSYAYYPNQKLYVDGSNDSSKASVLETQGYNNWAYLSFRYVLPLGENRTDPITVYRLDRGLPVNRERFGGGVPFVTGRSILEVRPFYNLWSAEKLLEEPQWTTQGFKIILQHDNTDYIDNPSRGYGFKLISAIDGGNGKSTQSWNAFEASYTQYIELPIPQWMRQNVIALNLWSAYSPSWDHHRKLDDESSSKIDAHRPPPWEGARLGGWDRMRAYAANRFSEKAALYYGAEYRFIPQFNPLHKQRWMPIAIDWFQGVFFAEAGRVAPHYDLLALNSHMKFDVGFSLRALAARLPVRLDVAAGGEGATMWVMVKQTF